jgi:pimeloyl-ACP methyl ester carboxylesterase
MGGMIAQLMAIARPERVLSLCSIMSFCDGIRDSAPATPEAQATLLTPPPTERGAYIDYMVEVNRVNWGPSFDAGRARERSAEAYDRAFHPAGTARHAAAVWATSGWRDQLGRVTAPALVIHGLEDPLVPVENGRRTHAALPVGAELLVIEGMGHDLPPREWVRMADAIAANAARATVAHRPRNGSGAPRREAGSPERERKDA